MSTTTTKARKVTYLGVPAEVWEEREAGVNGRRTVYTRWLAPSVGQAEVHPTGTVIATTVEGNFAKGTGRTIVAAHVVSL